MRRKEITLKYFGDRYQDGIVKRIFKKVKGTFDYRLLNYVKYISTLQVKIHALRYEQSAELILFKVLKQRLFYLKIHTLSDKIV